MTPEQRQQAGREVAARIKEMRTTPAAVARAAGVDPKTVRNLIDGVSWPQSANQARIEAVLRWRPGELAARAANLSTATLLLSLSDSEIASEMWRRAREREEQDTNTRRSDQKRN